MSSVFKGPKKPSDAGQKELIRRQREELAAQDAEIAERKAVRRRFGKGRSSLLSGSETGIPTRETLG